MSEDKGFEVIDKRRVGRQAEVAEEAAETEAEAPAAAEAAAADAEEEEEEIFAPPGTPTRVADLVQVCVGMMGEIAWVKMGLVPDPGTGEIEEDLAQAQLAIDCCADLAHRLSGHLEGPARRDVETLVQNLKLNFVRRKVGGTGPGTE